MDDIQFKKLVEMVVKSKNPPPAELFAAGVEDWHTRARLGHFLALPEFALQDTAISLFKSVADAETDEENAEDVEEKMYALQKLSALLREGGENEAALNFINQAIELAESTDYLYKYILRGELWAERWNLLHQLNQSAEAEEEVDARIEAYSDIPVEHVSYLYYGYRFKAQLAAERGVIMVARDYMYMALKYIEISPDNRKDIDHAFAQKHENISWILREIDIATPNPETLHWDI